MFETTPDDVRITEMDPIQKIWMFHQWGGDFYHQTELAKNHAYLIGSFTNPEAVQKLVSKEGVHQSSDEEFEETSKMIANFKNNNVTTRNNTKKKRKHFLKS